MEISLRDIYLPFLFIEIIIGYQITVYFLYQYFKYKQEKIELHNLLLGYGLIFGLILTAFTIRITNLYFLSVLYPSIFTILVKTTYLLLYLGIMIFYIIISSKIFNKIIKTSLIKVLAFLLIIPLLCVIFLKIETLIFSSIAGLTLLIYYSIILSFQMRLIRLTRGDIQKRLKLILIGILSCIISHFIGGYTPSYVLLEQFSDILQTISVPFFVVGLMTIFSGVYKFPTFLEFGWREHVLNLFIVNKTNYKILYNFDFKHVKTTSTSTENTKNVTNDKEFFFSRGIIGIDNIISIISNSNNKGIQQIKHGDFLILINYGEGPFSFVVFCLLVEREMKSLNYFIKKIKEEFQRMYSPVLYNITQLEIEDQEKKIFSGFDEILMEMIK